MRELPEEAKEWWKGLIDSEYESGAKLYRRHFVLIIVGLVLIFTVVLWPFGLLILVIGVVKIRKYEKFSGWALWHRNQYLLNKKLEKRK